MLLFVATRLREEDVASRNPPQPPILLFERPCVTLLWALKAGVKKSAEGLLGKSAPFIASMCDVVGLSRCVLLFTPI